MSFEIQRHEKFFEVSVFGTTSKLEILRILWDLKRRCPNKDVPDLWVIARESQVPFVHFTEIAKGVLKLLPARVSGSKSAILAPDAFAEAQVQMYFAEASFLPFPMRVFRSREEAVRWLLEPIAPPMSVAK